MLDIMIVDDDEGDRKLIRRLLRSSGTAHTIHEAGDAEAALGFAQQEIDAILLDNRLPGTTGLELMDRFANTWPRAAIFLMTGQGDEDIAKSAILRGACDYIPKSMLSPDRLERMLETGLKLSRMRWELEEQRQDLSQFCDVLVHDLRAPLRTLEFLNEQMSAHLDAGSLDGVAREFGMMQLSVQRLSELIESLASHIRLDGLTHWEHVSLDDLFQRVQLALAREIADSKAILHWHPNGLHAYCIAPQIAQLLQNLVSNALKHAAVPTPEIQISAKETEGGLEVTVADNGVGIPQKFAETIFEPFTRLPQGAAQSGSGLGLATCRKIAKRHGGKIWCDAQPQSGTRIRFTLKALAEAPQA